MQEMQEPGPARPIGFSDMGSTDCSKHCRWQKWWYKSTRYNLNVKRRIARYDPVTKDAERTAVGELNNLVKPKVCKRAAARGGKSVRWKHT
jgi:hypothetical protein